MAHKSLDEIFGLAVHDDLFEGIFVPRNVGYTLRNQVEPLFSPHVEPFDCRRK